MLIRTSAADFKQSIIDALQGVAKTCVNLMYYDNMLYIQTTNNIIIERRIMALLIEGKECTDITIMIDRTVDLLNSNEEFVYLDFSEDIVIVRQTGFSFSATRQPELRVELDKETFKEFILWEGYPLYRVVSDSRTLDDVAKLLGTEIAPINIVDNLAYVVYSNIVYIKECSLPDMRISSETVRKLVKALTNKNDTATYTFDKITGNLEIHVGNVTVIATTLNPDYKMTTALIEKEQELTLVSKVNISKYKSILDVLGRTYKKLLVDLSFCKRDLRVFVNNINTQLDLGSREEPEFTIRISTAQLQAINKLFGDCPEVDVLKGDNIVCLTLHNYKKTLIVSGMLY